MCSGLITGKEVLPGFNLVGGGGVEAEAPLPPNLTIIDVFITSQIAPETNLGRPKFFLTMLYKVHD